MEATGQENNILQGLKEKKNLSAHNSITNKIIINKKVKWRHFSSSPTGCRIRNAKGFFFLEKEKWYYGNHESEGIKGDYQELYLGKSKRPLFSS